MSWRFWQDVRDESRRKFDDAENSAFDNVFERLNIAATPAARDLARASLYAWRYLFKLRSGDQTNPVD